MDTGEIVKKLKSLVQLDIDAIHAYEQAIAKIDIQPIKDTLTQFKHDHKRHIENLSPFIEGNEGRVPEFSPDLKGYLIQGLTALRSITGTEGALKAMKSNEELTNKTYEEALSWDLPNFMRKTVESNREDERRHLQYIEECLGSKVWEQEKEDALGNIGQQEKPEIVTTKKSPSPQHLANLSESDGNELDEEIEEEIEEVEIIPKNKKVAS